MLRNKFRFFNILFLKQFRSWAGLTLKHQYLILRAFYFLSVWVHQLFSLHHSLSVNKQKLYTFLRFHYNCMKMSLFLVRRVKNLHLPHILSPLCSRNSLKIYSTYWIFAHHWGATLAGLSCWPVQSNKGHPSLHVWVWEWCSWSPIAPLREM